MEKVLITGVAGEVGSSLVHYLTRLGKCSITGFDLRAPDREVASLCSEVVTGDITDQRTVLSLGGEDYFDTIFHLAGILSSGGERAPLKAHDVNVTGSLNVLELARNHSEARGVSVKVVFTAMRLVNIATKKSRSIRRIEKQNLLQNRVTHQAVTW
jgi:nucleoside-diphosphate-sugar epimerase